MTDPLVQSKSQLARLLAEENIRVEHQQTKTACFDLKTRTLICPIWKEMTGTLYDLLLGHEVGHALYTRQDDWKRAVTSHPSTFKNFLNVCEDARIEKKMKRKFPGLVLSFFQGYQSLRKQDFFGVKDTTIGSLALIDRLNLFAKGGNLLESKFTPENMVYVKRLESLETWDEVVTLAEDLYAYEEAQVKTQQEQEIQPGDGEDGVEWDESEASEGDGGGDHMTGMSPDQTTEEQEQKMDQTGAGEGGAEDTSLPHARTDEAYQAHQNQLLNPASLDLMYITLPTPHLEHLVTPVAEVQAQLETHYTRYREYYDYETLRWKLYHEFMQDNNSYIDLLVQEFQQKKAATSYRRSKVDETGDLHPSRLYRYKLLDDQIFKKRTRVYQGQSHGMILLLDKSGSMTSQIRESVEQILVLALFCRKAGIPFTVYSFHGRGKRNAGIPWTYENGDVMMGDLELREMISSTMRADDFQTMVSYQLLLAQMLSKGSYNSYGIPVGESLNSTPLNEALVVMRPLMHAFRERHRIEKARLIIVQDGQSNLQTTVYDDTRSMNQRFLYIGGSGIPVLREKSTGQTWMKLNESTTHRLMTSMLLEWLSAQTGCEVIGFFTIPSKCSGLARHIDMLYRKTVTSERPDWNTVQAVKQQLRSTRYVESYLSGYSRFCLVFPARTSQDSSINTAATKAQVSAAFKNTFRKKAMNRVLATRFIPLIA